MTIERHNPAKEIKGAKTITEVELIQSAQSFLEANESAEGKNRLGFSSLKPGDFNICSIGRVMISGDFLRVVEPLYSFFYSDKQGEVLAVRYRSKTKTTKDNPNFFLTARNNKNCNVFELRKITKTGNYIEDVGMSDPITISSDDIPTFKYIDVLRSLIIAETKAVTS
jgi:hypothetical protein